MLERFDFHTVQGDPSPHREHPAKADFNASKRKMASFLHLSSTKHTNPKGSLSSPPNGEHSSKWENATRGQGDE